MYELWTCTAFSEKHEETGWHAEIPLLLKWKPRVWLDTSSEVGHACECITMSFIWNVSTTFGLLFEVARKFRSESDGRKQHRHVVDLLSIIQIFKIEQNSLYVLIAVSLISVWCPDLHHASMWSYTVDTLSQLPRSYWRVMLQAAVTCRDNEHQFHASLELCWICPICPK